MDMDLIFKVAGIGIVVAVLNQLLIRSGRDDQAMMTTLAGLVSVMMIMITEISKLFDAIRAAFGF
ncbi:MAG: stage III sporulation protein AC [Ruminococcaceae bacterium]|nr:stage III sporulation protein AC [Oscillospiraceae bacterium]